MESRSQLVMKKFIIKIDIYLFLPLYPKGDIFTNNYDRNYKYENVLTTRKNKGLSFNSVLWTRSYSDSKNCNFTGLDGNWVTGLVEAEGSFIVFVKLNTNNSKNLVRQIQLSFEVSVYIKDIDLLYKLKSFFFEEPVVSFLHLLEKRLD